MNFPRSTLAGPTPAETEMTPPASAELNYRLPPSLNRATNGTNAPPPYARAEFLDMVQKSPAAAIIPDKAGTLCVERYTPARKAEWDRFVIAGKNATFLFQRDYMDYHQDRFTDHSLMIFAGGELVGLAPANLATDGSLFSHQGLTYGGLVVARDARLKEVLGCFHAVLKYLADAGISKWFYKRIPSFYHTLSADDLAYALFLVEARLYRQDCATTVAEADRLPFVKSREALIKKATGLDIRIVQEISFQPFWEQVLEPQLASRHQAKPVHTLAEITRLAARFPDEIKQFSAYCGTEIMAGATIYETPTVAHSQYAAVTDQGRQNGAQAYLFSWLIDHYRAKHFFDFGTSNEHEGRAINHGLLRWKEGFGARCYTHDFYEITTAHHVKLEPILEGRSEIIALPPAPPPAAPVANGIASTAFVHPQALVGAEATIGAGTRVWAFAHIVSPAIVGADCNICDHTFIEGGVQVGNRVTLKCGVYLWDGLRIEDDVFIGPAAVFTNDYRPRSKKFLKEYLETVLQEGCSIGANSTILPGLTIGRWAMVGAGSVVTRNVPDFALVVGNPARFRSWICRCGEKLPPAKAGWLPCECGRFYEQITETEIKEAARG